MAKNFFISGFASGIVTKPGGGGGRFGISTVGKYAGGSRW
jgi:hypothetical protein